MLQKKAHLLVKNAHRVKLLKKVHHIVMIDKNFIKVIN